MLSGHPLLFPLLILLHLHHLPLLLLRVTSRHHSSTPHWSLHGLPSLLSMGRDGRELTVSRLRRWRRRCPPLLLTLRRAKTGEGIGSEYTGGLLDHGRSALASTIATEPFQGRLFLLLCRWRLHSPGEHRENISVRGRRLHRCDRGLLGLREGVPSATRFSRWGGCCPSPLIPVDFEIGVCIGCPATVGCIPIHRKIVAFRRRFQSSQLSSRTAPGLHLGLLFGLLFPLLFQLFLLLQRLFLTFFGLVLR
mmetsp:Transcript_15222/g.30829  ORF Transcript_15222/g.30829 Transcript_15222/m.30829 type:complete len:250 (-) Transcript_15222:1146-1895(-)